jgi:hypothetical protein
MGPLGLVPADGARVLGSKHLDRPARSACSCQEPTRPTTQTSQHCQPRRRECAGQSLSKRRDRLRAMGRKRNPHLGSLPDRQQRDQVAAVRAQGLSFAAIGAHLGIRKQAAWYLCRQEPARHPFGVRCATCAAVVADRYFQERTVGEVLCRACLAAGPAASFALRLRSLRVAAGLTQRALEQAGGLSLGRLKEFEDERPSRTNARGPRWLKCWAPRPWSGPGMKGDKGPDLVRRSQSTCLRGTTRAWWLVLDGAATPTCGGAR